jgi:hypothetical protein
VVCCCPLQGVSSENIASLMLLIQHDVCVHPCFLGTLSLAPRTVEEIEEQRRREAEAAAARAETMRQAAAEAEQKRQAAAAEAERKRQAAARAEAMKQAAEAERKRQAAARAEAMKQAAEAERKRQAAARAEAMKQAAEAERKRQAAAAEAEQERENAAVNNKKRHTTEYNGELEQPAAPAESEVPVKKPKSTRTNRKVPTEKKVSADTPTGKRGEDLKKVKGGEFDKDSARDQRFDNTKNSRAQRRAALLQKKRNQSQPKPAPIQTNFDVTNAEFEKVDSADADSPEKAGQKTENKEDAEFLQSIQAQLDDVLKDGLNGLEELEKQEGDY